MTGHACSECGRRKAGEPGTEHRMPCRCEAGTGPLTPDERRAAHEDRRAARTAEMAAAEDFDPLRIRPYVTLADSGPASEDSGAYEASEAPGAYGVSEAYGALDSSGVHGSSAAYGAYDPSGTPGVRSSSEAYGAYDPSGAVYPEAGGVRRRTGGAVPASGLGPDPVQPRRRRPFAAVAAGAAVAAVVGTAAFAGGLFGGAEESADEALPEITRSVPDGVRDEPAASVAPSPSPSASAAPSRTPSASATPSATPSASPSASASATKTRKPAPTASAPSPASPGLGGSPAPGGGAPAPAPTADPPPAGIAATTLRPGDRGPQVVELQNRLRQIGTWLYAGPSDGHYTDRVAYSVAFYQSYMGVHGDPTGVYGPHTRSRLEEQTSGGRPGHR
ncbi:peptidoglycan-binding protein [Streptomyces sp. NPDC017448]|uniref:peptidoglycan-binding protein n=1 Tax=Streptomyces sp. NPDC017448 TaxID=3364996 RepID=UPI00378E49A8